MPTTWALLIVIPSSTGTWAEVGPTLLLMAGQGCATGGMVKVACVALRPYGHSVGHETGLSKASELQTPGGHHSQGILLCHQGAPFTGNMTRVPWGRAIHWPCHSGPHLLPSPDPSTPTPLSLCSSRKGGVCSRLPQDKATRNPARWCCSLQ